VRILEALYEAAARTGRSIVDVVGKTIRKIVLKPNSSSVVGMWDGEPKRCSSEHDSVYDEV
jgi:hypothetical protein